MSFSLLTRTAWGLTVRNTQICYVIKKKKKKKKIYDVIPPDEMGNPVMSWSMNCPHCISMTVKRWWTSLLGWTVRLTLVAAGSSNPRASRVRGALTPEKRCE